MALCMLITNRLTISNQHWCIPIVGNLIKLEFGDGKLFVCTKGCPFDSNCHFAIIIITIVIIIVHNMLKI
jgi:hypothetical protein